MNFEYWIESDGLRAQKVGREYILNPLSKCSFYISLRKGFYLTVSLLLPNGKVKPVIQCDNEIPEKQALNGKGIKEVSFKVPNLQGEGAIDIFFTRESFLGHKELSEFIYPYQFIEQAAIKLDSLKKWGLVLQAYFCSI